MSVVSIISPFDRPPLGGQRARLLAGTALALALAAHFGVSSASAQTQPGQTQPIQLPPVSVGGTQTNDTGYRPDQPSLLKLPEPLLDTPQSVTVVPKQYMQDRGITNESDALRSVPGISLAAGEAGAQGNNLTLRGFTARNDIFLDGMRDFGSYYRDPFNLDEIEVLEGPSSVLFGRGSTGGVINQVSKMPQLTPLIGGSMELGTDNTKRATVDLNQPLPDLGQGAAFRLDLMAHDSQVAERNVGEYRRFGLAPSLAFGIGTPTRLTFSYFHESEDDVPDYGLPFLLGRPAPVSRSNFYGFTSDYLKTNADIGTVKLEHDVNDSIMLRNQFRYASYDRNARITEPQIAGTPTASTPLSDIVINRNEIAVKSTETFLENQADATFKFRTGFIHHTVITGVEIGRETSDPVRYTYTGVPTTNLLSPVSDIPFSGVGSIKSDVHTASNTFGIYALDTMKFGEQWELTGGLRWDRYATSYTESVAGVGFTRVDQMPTWRTALVYKPLPNGSVYVAYGTSFNPSAETLSLSAANANVAPEQNASYAIGNKWDLLHDTLMLRGAVFRTDKTNAREPDPTNPLLNVLGADQRVDGFEVEAAGHLTDKWQVYSGYAYMSGEVVKSSPTPNSPLPGAPLTNVPKNSFNLWTTYDLPWRFQIGGGVNYLSSRVARNTAPIETVPGYWTADAMVKYHLAQHVDLQMNLYNITDTNYIDLVHPAHIVPGAGRTAYFTVNFQY